MRNLSTHDLDRGIRRSSTLAAVAAATLLALPPAVAAAQSSSSLSSDARWTPWLGCWQVDSATASPQQLRSNLTCVIPTTRSTAVDVVSLVDGSIVSRQTLEANGRSHAVEQAACTGDETGIWSAGYRRVYFRSNYTCNGTRGSSTRMFAIGPSGEWLEIETIHSGGGTIDHVTRRHDVGIPGRVPAEVVHALAGRDLSIQSARAIAAAPPMPNDVVEAVQNVDAGVVRSWLVGINARFALDAVTATMLIHENVPTSVLQAMLGETRYADEASIAESNRQADEYLRSTSVANSGIVMDGSAASAAAAAAMVAASVAMMSEMCLAQGCFQQSPYSPYNAFQSAFNQFPTVFGAGPFFSQFGFGNGGFLVIHHDNVPFRQLPIVIHHGPVGVPVTHLPVTHGGMRGR